MYYAFSNFAINFIKNYYQLIVILLILLFFIYLFILIKSKIEELKELKEKLIERKKMIEKINKFYNLDSSQLYKLETWSDEILDHISSNQFNYYQCENFLNGELETEIDPKLLLFMLGKPDSTKTKSIKNNIIETWTYYKAAKPQSGTALRISLENGKIKTIEKNETHLYKLLKLYEYRWYDRRWYDKRY